MEEETVEEKPVEEEKPEEVAEEKTTETTEEPKEEVTEEKKGFEREMHKAVCADCGKECEVPFKPIAGRKIYCRDCYRKHRPRRF